MLLNSVLPDICVSWDKNNKGPIPLFHIAHVKQPQFSPPSEPFVRWRVLNPVCKRPIPLLTEELYPGSNDDGIQIFPISRLGVLTRRIELGMQLVSHWSPYYFSVLRSLRPQLIHAHFSFSAEPVMWSSKILNIPLLANFYGVETKRFIHEPSMRPRLLRLISQAEHITCLSQAMFDDLLGNGCPPDKLSLIRLGVDTEFFTGAPHTWDSGKILHLISIARLHPEKGLGYLLRALHQVKQTGFQNWDLRIVGTGHIEQELKKQTVELGLAMQVKFLGALSPAQVADELRQAHLMVLPSVQETQGVSLQEAQACYTPVISTKVGGIPEGVCDGQTGILVNPRDPAALAQAILAFVENPQRIPDMGIAGRRYVQENFSRNEEYRQLADLYDRVIRNYRQRTQWQ